MSGSTKLKNHQDIEVKQQASSGRLKIVRQDRKSVEHLDAFIESSDLTFPLVNVSNFGILAETPTKPDWDIKEFALIIENVELGSYRLKVVRTYSEDATQYTAFEIVGDIVDTSCIETIREANQIIDKHRQYSTTNDKIPDRFARQVYEIKDWLEELQKLISELEAEKNNLDPNDQTAYEGLLTHMISSYMNELLPGHNSHLEALLDGLNDEEMKACYYFFREKLKKLIYQAPISNRIFNKPLGYAGDFEMMNIIYRSLPEGKTLFAKCLHQYWVSQPAAQAVRNRASYLKSKILNLVDASENEELNILSVACGPAKEWQQICVDLDSNQHISVDLLDQDELALQGTQKILKNLNQKDNIEFNYHHKAIKNIIARGLPQEYDLIYSAGLFDYFSAPVAKLAIDRLYKALKPGGQVIIGNFNVDNPNSITMDLALDWHLIYRSEEELKELLHVPGSEISIEKEDLNINLFCIIEKPC